MPLPICNGKYLNHYYGYPDYRVDCPNYGGGCPNYSAACPNYGKLPYMYMYLYARTSVCALLTFFRLSEKDDQLSRGAISEILFATPLKR